MGREFLDLLREPLERSLDRVRVRCFQLQHGLSVHLAVCGRRKEALSDGEGVVQEAAWAFQDARSLVGAILRVSPGFS